jgi:hypothetical protein
MRKLVIGLLFVLLAMPTGFAQWKQRATVAAPFEFAVDNTVLPAGTYAVLLNAQTHGVMLLNREAQVSATAHSHDIFLIASGVAASSKLIFALDGKRHVLHQVMVEGDNHMHDLIHGSEVAELSREPAT